MKKWRKRSRRYFLKVHYPPVFSKGFTHTLNNVDSISNTIIAVMKGYESSKHGIVMCKALYCTEHGAKVKELSNKLENEF